MSEPEAPTPRVPFWGYYDLLVFAGATFASLLAASFFVQGFWLVFSLGGRGKAPQLLAAQFLGYGLCFTFLWGWLRLKYGRPLWVSLGWVRMWEKFGQRAAWGVVVSISIAVAGVVLRTPDVNMPMKQLLSDRLSILLVGVAAATAGPVCEELAFRGFLQPLLVRSLGAAPGILLTALPFGLLHGPEYAWSWQHVLFIVLAGASFGWMKYRTGSTAAAAVMHAAYNSTLFVAFLLYGKDLPPK
jgi:CAAX protease family protein